jgi:hypothetical protein
VKYVSILLLALLVSLQSFAAEPPKGKLDGSKYTYGQIGWVFLIPDGWSLRSGAEIARVRGVGKKAFEEGLDQEIPMTPTPLLYLHNGKRNNFTSDAQTYDRSSGDYEKNQDQLNAQIQAIYKSRGYNVRNSKSKRDIDGVKFLVYRTDILSRDRSKVLVKSVLFSALIHNIDFGMSYTCVDRKECDKIRSAIANSSFTREIKPDLKSK